NPYRRPRLAGCNRDVAAFAAASTNPLCVAWTERPAEPDWILNQEAKLTDLRPRLFVGLIPPEALRANFYRDIPNWLRPVPLNFIYKPLAQGMPARIAAENIFFDFLDFDAF